MTSHSQLVKNAYEFFHKGDIPGLIRELIHDDCVWNSPGPKDKLPWAGTYKGKDHIRTFFRAVKENLEFPDFAAEEIIERGDTVIALGKSAGTVKKTGKIVEEDWAHVFKFKDGKIIYWREYLDTAASVIAMS